VAELDPWVDVPSRDDLEGRVRSLEAAVMHLSGRVGTGPFMPSPAQGYAGPSPSGADLAAERAVSAGLRTKLAEVERQLEGADARWQRAMDVAASHWRRAVERECGESRELRRDMGGTLAELEKARWKLDIANKEIETLRNEVADANAKLKRVEEDSLYDIPEGYALVPRVVSKEMRDAARNTSLEAWRANESLNGSIPIDMVWNAMINEGELKR